MQDGHGLHVDVDDHAHAEGQAAGGLPDLKDRCGGIKLDRWFTDS